MSIMSTLYTKLINMVSQNSLGVSATDSLPRSIRYGLDGMRMYMVGAGGKKIYQFELAKRYDPTTATYSKALDTSTIDTDIYSVDFKPDGTLAYIVGATGKKVYKLTMSTAWDISTATLTNSFSTGTLVPICLKFRNTGLVCFVMCVNGSNVMLYQLNLSTAWDITTASFDAKIRTLGDTSTTLPCGFDFSTDGKYFYNTQAVGKIVIEHKLANEWDFVNDLASNNVSLASLNYPMGVTFNSNFNRVQIVDQNNKKIYQYRV